MTPGIPFLAMGRVTDRLAEVAFKLEATPPIPTSESDVMDELQTMMDFQRHLGASLEYVFGPGSFAAPATAHLFMERVGQFVGKAAANLPGDKEQHLHDLLDQVSWGAHEAFRKDEGVRGK